MLTVLVAVAAIIALIFIWGKLHELQARFAQVGLHHVRISCVDARTGATLQPKLVNLPVPESDFVAATHPGPVTVFWSGLKSDGNLIGAWAEGYDVKLLPAEWDKEQEVILRLSRTETKNDEQDAP